MTFIVLCIAVYVIALGYVLITAVRRPDEFKEAVNELIDDMLDI